MCMSWSLNRQPGALHSEIPECGRDYFACNSLPAALIRFASISEHGLAAWTPRPDQLVEQPEAQPRLRMNVISQCRANGIWRRGRDSNPRYGFPHTHFPGVRLQPLGHPSAAYAWAHAVIEEGARVTGALCAFSHSATPPQHAPGRTQTSLTVSEAPQRKLTRPNVRRA